MVSGVDISEVPGYHLLRKMSSQWAPQKLLKGLVSHELTVYLSVSDLFLAQWIMVTSKRCKPDNFEFHNSLKLSFTNIWGLHMNFVDCESFIESNSEILVLCETNLDDSVDSHNFFVRGYLPLIRKDSVTHVHGLAVYVKEVLPWLISADSYLCFWWALLHSGGAPKFGSNDRLVSASLLRTRNGRNDYLLLSMFLSEKNQC